MACRGRERVLIISIMSSAGEAGKLQSVLPGVLVFDTGVTARARNKGTRERAGQSFTAGRNCLSFEKVVITGV